MYRITDNLYIPEAEVSFVASRSGGPGGQNVNKVSSRVTLFFDVFSSSALTDGQKAMIAGRLATRINKEGILRVVSQRTRSQELNRIDALEKFVDLLRRALSPKRARIRTSTPVAAKERRLNEKKKRTAIKQSRAKGDWE